MTTIFPALTSVIVRDPSGPRTLACPSSFIIMVIRICPAGGTIAVITKLIACAPRTVSTTSPIVMDVDRSITTPRIPTPATIKSPAAIRASVAR